MNQCAALRCRVCLSLKEVSQKQRAPVQDERDAEKKTRKRRSEFTKLTTLIFVFVAVRGPLFRVEDVTRLGWKRVNAWRALKSLVKAGVLQKFDRKSYGLAGEARGLFRAAFGGGANDAPFAYSTMGVESWSKVRLERFKERLSEMWEQRPQRIKKDPARTDLTANERFELQKLLFEKIEEASQITMMLQRASGVASRDSPK